MSGRPAFGVSLMFPSPQVVDMIGKLGFDWILIDCEHGSISWESVELLAMAAEASEITPIARPRSNDPEEITAILDRGVMGVQIPHVNTAEEARRAVTAVKYAPLGKRGLAAGTRSADYGFGLSMADYVVAANRETLVCVQLEDEEALRNADAILQVDGVDVFFIGPSDLSQSLGYPGQPKAAKVREAMEKGFGRIAAAGKAAGSAGDAEATRFYLNHQVRYLYTHLTTLLSMGSREFLEAAKA